MIVDFCFLWYLKTTNTKRNSLLFIGYIEIIVYIRYTHYTYAYSWTSFIGRCLFLFNYYYRNYDYLFSNFSILCHIMIEIHLYKFLISLQVASDKEMFLLTSRATVSWERGKKRKNRKSIAWNTQMWNHHFLFLLI